MIHIDDLAWVPQAGAHIAEPAEVEYNKQRVEVYPRIVWSPFWALTFADVKAKVEKLSVSQKSTLVLEGANITLKDVTVDGALVIKAAPGAKVGALPILRRWLNHGIRKC